MKTPAEIAAKWSRRLAGAREDMIAGARSVTESPGVAAANNIARYQAGVMDALNSGKTEAAMRAVPLALWQDRYTGKGVTNAVTAANDTTIKNKVQAYQQEAAQTYEAIKARVKEMKRNGSPGIDRVAESMRMMEEFGASRRP